MIKNENRDFYLSPMSASTGILGPVWVPITELARECDRLRFGIAHESGYFVMHYSRRTSVKTIEEEMNEFTTELVLPRSAI